MINSFLIQKIPRDRKEAPPLPLWILVQWERRILMSACTISEIIMLGNFLLMAWASLRFSDAQRIEMARMVLSTTDLRGIIWRSKTTTVGMPFGAMNSGILSKGAHSWMWKFIKTMDSILNDNGAPDVDFLLPHCDADLVSFPLTPMTYATALFHFRRLIHCPWRSSSNPMTGLDLNFTLHSLKATLLSWGPQLSMHTQPEQRLQQGHHVSQSSSLAVYSRDSVWGALDFQNRSSCKCVMAGALKLLSTGAHKSPYRNLRWHWKFFPSSSLITSSNGSRLGIPLKSLWIHFQMKLQWSQIRTPHHHPVHHPRMKQQLKPQQNRNSQGAQKLHRPKGEFPLHFDLWTVPMCGTRDGGSVGASALAATKRWCSSQTGLWPPYWNLMDSCWTMSQQTTSYASMQLAASFGHISIWNETRTLQSSVHRVKKAWPQLPSASHQNQLLCRHHNHIHSDCRFFPQPFR